MKSNSKSPAKELDQSARFYVIFSELAKTPEEQVELGVPLGEMDEIEQVMQAIVDVNDEPPQFVTST